MKKTILYSALAVVLLLSACSPELETYTVTFDSRGGSYTPKVQSVKKGDTAIEPKSPTKSDTFGFRRWRLEGGAEEAYDFNTPVSGNITLWAEYWPAKEIDDSKKIAYSMVYYWNIIRTIIENDSFSKGGSLDASFPHTNVSNTYKCHTDGEKTLAYILANTMGLKDDCGGSHCFSYYNEKEEEQYTAYYQTDDEFFYEIEAETKCDSNTSSTDGSLYNIDIENLKIVLHGHKPGETFETEDSEGEYLEQKDSYDATFSSVLSLKGIVKKSSADDPEYEIRMDVTLDGVKKAVKMSFVKPKNASSEYIIYFTIDDYSSYLIYRD